MKRGTEGKREELCGGERDQRRDRKRNKREISRE